MPIDRLLNMSVSDFFTERRFMELGISKRLAGLSSRAAVRLRFTVGAGREFWRMQELLDFYQTRDDLMKERDVGEKITNAIILAIKSAGLPFRG